MKLKLNIRDGLKSKFARPTFGALVILIVLFVLALTSYLFFAQEKINAEASARVRLEAINSSKVSEIRNWLTERLGDVKVASQAIITRRLTDAYKNNKKVSNGDHDLAVDQFRHMRDAYGYGSIRLVAQDGAVILSTQESSAAPIELQLLKNLAETNSIGVSKPYVDVNNNQLFYIDIIAGVHDAKNPQERAVTFIVLQAIPTKFVLPILNSANGQFRSFEILLGIPIDRNLFVMSSQSQLLGFFDLDKVPVLKKAVEEIRAHDTRPDDWYAKDRKNNDVLVNAQAIPNSDWVLVAKIDSAEVYENVLRNTALSIFLVILLGTMVIGVVVYWLMRKNSIIAQANQKRLAESEDELRSIFTGIKEAYIKTRLSDSAIIKVNPAAL